MIIFIGLLGLLFFFHHELEEKISNVFAKHRSNWLQVESDKLKDWFFPSIALGFTSINLVNNMQMQAGLWRTQIWSLRRFLFSASQTILSYFLIITLLVMAFEVNSLVLIAAIIPIWFLTRLLNVYFLNVNKNVVTFVKMTELLLGLVVLLYLVEQVFKNSNLIMPFLQESEIVYYLTDSNWLHFLVLFSVGLLAGFIFPIQGYSIYLSFFMYLNSQISYLGFVSFVFGELIFTYGKMYIHYRKMNKEYFEKIKKLFLYLAVIMALVFISIVYLRFGLQFGNSYGDSTFQKWLFIGTLVYIFFSVYLTFMVWGHFNFQRQDPEVKLTDSEFNLHKVNSEEVYGAELLAMEYIRKQLDQRLKKLNEFQLELTEETKKKIPLFVLKKFDNEKDILIKLLAETDK